MKYNIGVDLTYIIDNKMSGIRKYAEEMLEGFMRLNLDHKITLFVYDDLKEIFSKKFPNYKIVSIKCWRKKGINKLKIIKYIKMSKIEKENCDVMIYPYINSFIMLSRKKKKIIGILDVIPLDIIEDKESKLYNKIKRENIDLMSKTEYITTLSNYSKKRLLEINPKYKGEITVIPSSVIVPKKSEKNAEEMIDFDKPYILSINSFFKHKNQITLVKAFNKIKEKVPHKLVLVGRPELGSNSGYNEIINYIKEKNLEDRVIILSYISDEYRNSLLYNADLFVTTSMQEGFGRTPVEASMCNIPVISTKETSLPEATMNEVFYYENPTDEIELSKKILEVLNNKPSKERLKEISKKFEMEYNEERIAKRYVDLIDKIMEK